MLHVEATVPKMSLQPSQKCHYKRPPMSLHEVKYYIERPQNVITSVPKSHHGDGRSIETHCHFPIARLRFLSALIHPPPSGAQSTHRSPPSPTSHIMTVGCHHRHPRQSAWCKLGGRDDMFIWLCVCVCLFVLFVLFVCLLVLFV